MGKKHIFIYLILIGFLLTTSIPLTFAQDTKPDFLEGPGLRNSLDLGNFAEAVDRIEKDWEEEFQAYFKEDFAVRSKTVDEISKTLARLALQTKKKPALIYVIPRADQLELLLITPDRPPFRHSVLAAKRDTLIAVVQEFISEITNLRKINTTSYLNAAQQLYQWIIAPLELNLQLQKIDTLLFCVGGGLRTLPLPALHDGQRFLTEKYSLARIPAFKFTDSNYADIRKSQVLAMGASDFSNFSQQQPLPAVPLELKTISQTWPTQSFLNKDFTVVNLQSERLRQRFAIIHLATHAEFKPGTPNNSYIQFWDTQLKLNQIRALGWNNPPVELLVLSACRTGLGDKTVELGFAGLAVEAGVKSALASIWYVSDAGTLALMTEFYQQLKTAPIKAEALRQAQIAMIQGKVRLENGALQSSRGSIPLPPDLVEIGNQNLSHPYYWAAFSIIGSPW
ncbi:CHAT domain-containing protein [Oscillatoriales cyanobacterium USR001]|nr:CHAT domain-containing protein [Oscillatoriales cyanobacterium USR001]